MPRAMLPVPMIVTSMLPPVVSSFCQPGSLRGSGRKRARCDTKRPYSGTQPRSSRSRSRADGGREALRPPPARRGSSASTMPAWRRASGVRIKRSSRRATCPNKLTGAAATPSVSSLARSRISRTTEGTSSLVQSAETGLDQSSRHAARSEALSAFGGGGGVRGASESAWPPRLRRLAVPVGGRRCDTAQILARQTLRAVVPAVSGGAPPGDPPPYVPTAVSG